MKNTRSKKTKSGQEKKDEHQENSDELLQACEMQKNEYLDGWKRARADFLNYQKEEQERVSHLVEYALEGVLERVLPILDSFQIANENLSEKEREDAKIQGFLHIRSQLEDFLRSQGVETVDTVGKRFDPQVHEVVDMVENTEQSGFIIEEVRAGYMMRGKLLRPAKVKVAK